MELARQLVDEGLVASISPQTVRRILSGHKLNPWRLHYWLSPDKPCDGEFYSSIHAGYSRFPRGSDGLPSMHQGSDQVQLWPGRQ